MIEALVTERSVTVRKVKLSPAGEARVQKCTSEGLCCWCLDPLPPGLRTVANGVKCGCHATTCYETQRIAIAEGRESKTALIRDGYRLQDKAPGPARSKEFPAAMAKA